MHTPRLHLLDSLRGLTLLSMITYHASWDLVWIFGVDWPWYLTRQAYYWQQSICWTFILLSGFCFHLGRKRLKRGLLVFGSSVLISAITILLMPEDTILFGVLSLIGSAMLLLIPLDDALRRIPPLIGALASFVLFRLTRWFSVGAGMLFGRVLFRLPDGLFANLFTAYLGFPTADFMSQDYFPLLPWMFLYLTGYFLYGIVRDANLLHRLSAPCIPPLEWLGRHSLLIYLLHQPVIYAVLMPLFR